MPKPKPLLRRGKYYARANNGACAKCKSGKYGCCYYRIEVSMSDFKIDWTNQEQVNALAQTGVFDCSLGIGDYYDGSFRFSLKKRLVGEKHIHSVCVMWTDKGCRLAYDAKPAICRRHTCRYIEENLDEFNLRDKERSSRRTFRKRKAPTKEELKVVFNAFIDCDNVRPLNAEQYAQLDWDFILKTLQGKC